MIILAISTSSNICSVALLENEKCIKELNIKNEKTHSENLVPLIDELFKITNYKISDVNLIACDNGPGSFTGIRIGIATIKALAEVNLIPVVAISSLEGLAYNISDSENVICSLLDAKNNQVYCGIFDKTYKLLQDYIADDINSVVKILKSYTNINFVGNGSIIHSDLLNCNNIYDNDIHAYNIGLCGYNKYLSNNFQSADSIVPMYLRKSQAERMKLQNE